MRLTWKEVDQSNIAAGYKGLAVVDADTGALIENVVDATLRCRLDHVPELVVTLAWCGPVKVQADL